MVLDCSLLDLVQEGVVVVDAGGVVRFWNQIMALWSGKSAEAVVGMDVVQLAPKLGEARYRKRLDAALAQMAPVTFSAALHHHIFPCPLAPKRYRALDTQVRPLERDGERLLLMSMVDRTDHMASIIGLKKVNNRLKRSMRLRRESDRINTMLAAGMDNAAEAIVVVDHKGHVEYANPMFYQMARCPIPSARHCPLTELLYVDQADALEKEVASAIASGENWRGRVVVQRPDGHRFPVSVSAAPVRLRKGRRVSHAVLTLEDITDYELTNRDLQARKKHEAMLTMVAGISHDFNNLLSGMVGNAYLLRKSVRGDDKAMRRLDTVEASLREATEIIQNLMIYARGDAMVQGVLPLAPFIKEWCKEVRGLLPEGVALNIELQQDHFPVKVDVSLLQHALMAVAENAIDAVAEVEEPAITIQFGRAQGEVPAPIAPDQPCVRLVVRDNGCGIADDLLPKVCDPFFSTKQLGSGLGLSVAQSSIEQHGGVLRIASRVGEGTTVTIWLPLAE